MKCSRSDCSVFRLSPSRVVFTRWPEPVRHASQYRLSPSTPPVANAFSACSFSFQPGIKCLPPSYTSRTTASIAVPLSISTLLVSSSRRYRIVGDESGQAESAQTTVRACRHSEHLPGEALHLSRALVLSAQPLELLGIQAHAEREAHRPEHRLDLVERLLAEVLRLEQLGLGLPHEVRDGPDVRGLEAVGRAAGELELLDVAEEVLLPLGPRPRLGALGRRLLRCRRGEVREQLEVVLEDPRCLGDRRGRRDAAIGPHLPDEPLLAVRRGLDVEVHPLDG